METHRADRPLSLGAGLPPGRRSSDPGGGAALLLAGSPREVLARIVPGDPLAVRPRLEAALRRRAVLVDSDRAFLRALAECAREAPGWRGRPPLDAWIDRRIEGALDGLLAEEEDEPAGAAESGEGSAFRLLALPLGLDPAHLARACRAFNRLPGREREAFFLLVIEDRGLEASGTALGVSALECARAARRALDVFLVPPLLSTLSPPEA
ncbi:MAG: hypothetical protein AB1726_11445 [Planctomycetota bacterium]